MEWLDWRLYSHWKGYIDVSRSDGMQVTVSSWEQRENIQKRDQAIDRRKRHTREAESFVEKDTSNPNNRNQRDEHLR